MVVIVKKRKISIRKQNEFNNYEKLAHLADSNREIRIVIGCYDVQASHSMRYS